MLNVILNRIKSNYITILGNNLVGIYLHGSIAFDCYHPETSDIDFIVVIQRKIDYFTKRSLIERGVKRTLP